VCGRGQGTHSLHHLVLLLGTLAALLLPLGACSRLSLRHQFAQ
jgi:hypothetical protein